MVRTAHLREMHPWPLIQPAGWWPRFMSAFVDLSVLVAIWILSGLLIWIWIGTLQETPDLLGVFLQNPKMLIGASLLWIVAPGLAGWGYFVLLRAACGQTLGEALWGLSVVRDDGTTLNLGDALLREIGAVFSFVPLGAGYWWSLLNAQGRTWHGLLSRTRVVEAWPRFYT